ncbi:SDR family oxidoreductase [Olivibacter sitiensis]|uniref:SDR family oxidoreductase n=1 Tax=Olivibacter sitiensis TaxID=376470 RepID=UPI00040F7371|nr:SDR family oxidoreductase [Olivibacter sitiensis]
MAKTVLITGSSSGFGKEAAKLFQKNGWNVIATMRSPEKETELNTLENVLVTKLDVQNIDSIHSGIKAGIEKFDKIDVVVNNAGYGTFGVFENATDEQIRRQFEVNVFGLMNVTKAILPNFRENKNGLFINLSSMGGKITLPMMSLYHATKFAVEGFTESLFHELYSLNIHVKLIEPGGVDTNFGKTSMDYISNTIKDYEPFLENANSYIQKFLAERKVATVEDVAQTIFNAATDNKEQLRYVIGDDAQKLIDHLQPQNDQEYVSYMKNLWGTKNQL